MSVWRFDQAPRHLRTLFPRGEANDWLAEVPAALGRDFVDWLYSNWLMRYSISDRRELGNGTVIYLGGLSISDEITKLETQGPHAVVPDQMRAKSSSLSRPV